MEDKTTIVNPLIVENPRLLGDLDKKTVVSRGTTF